MPIWGVLEKPSLKAIAWEIMSWCGLSKVSHGNGNPSPFLPPPFTFERSRMSPMAFTL
jgi:hypothetical protein